jgi:aspartate racemase
LQHRGEWEATTEILTRAAQSVEAGGADFLIICTNTMHKVAPGIEARVSIPLLHIADATAQRLVIDGVKRAGLLGTRFTMEQAFYRERLERGYGIEVLVPDRKERDLVHDVIYSELCLGRVVENSRNDYLRIIDSLQRRGAEAVILGCTEIAMLIQQAFTTMPLHAQQTVAYALDERDKP